MKYGTRINFERYSSERSMCAPSLQREFGIYGEYMSPEVRDRSKYTLEVLGEHLPHCRIERPACGITHGRSSGRWPCVLLSLSVSGRRSIYPRSKVHSPALACLCSELEPPLLDGAADDFALVLGSGIGGNSTSFMDGTLCGLECALSRGVRRPG